MKISKSLFLAFAGRGLFACSNEDVTENGGIEGVKNVSVTLNLPKAGTNILSRTLGSGISASDATLGSGTVPVEIKKISVTLHSADGDDQQIYTQASGDNDNFTLEEEPETHKQTATLTFQSVRNPISIEVSVNDGTSTNLTLDDINGGIGLAAPLYKSVPASEFQPNGDNAMKVTVTPLPRYARLELSGISRAATGTEADDVKDIFKEATLAGMYLTGVYTDESKSTTAHATSGWDAVQSKPATGYDAATWSVLGGSFVTTGAKWPADATPAKAYAYNIFEGMPSLVFVLSDVTLEDDAIIANWDKSSPIYAKVGKFTTTASDDANAGISNGVITTFKAGYIYRITSIAIPDYVWGTNPEEGGSEITLTATVEVQPWNLVDGSASWGN